MQKQSTYCHNLFAFPYKPIYYYNMRMVQEKTKFIPIWDIYLSLTPTFKSLTDTCADFWVFSLFSSSSGGQWEGVGWDII